ncbi:MAG: hypothetical protein JWN74_451 [Acidobacteriaceae bacterium]|nr:hypothetical protein [Acidobacteriaceae bacterium]
MAVLAPSLGEQIGPTANQMTTNYELALVMGNSLSKMREFPVQLVAEAGVRESAIRGATRTEPVSASPGPSVRATALAASQAEGMNEHASAAHRVHGFFLIPRLAAGTF